MATAESRLSTEAMRATVSTAPATARGVPSGMATVPIWSSSAPPRSTRSASGSQAAAIRVSRVTATSGPGTALTLAGIRGQSSRITTTPVAASRAWESGESSEEPMD